MVVLTRCLGEETVIAGDIRVTVVAVDGHQVRLGITALRSIPVARVELLAENFEKVASPMTGRTQENQRILRSP
jgi:carbon storage regulator CsrA